MFYILIGKVPPNELQIYTWMDATLRELTSLVREVNPESRKKGTYFDFAVISPQNGRGMNAPNGVFCHYASRDIGTTVSGTKGMDDNKTLTQARFVIGDYVDIAITPPNPGGGGRAHRLDRIGGKLIDIFYVFTYYYRVRGLKLRHFRRTFFHD